MEMAITAWLGIDVAKQKFDVALNWKTRRRAKVFRNDAEGWQAPQASPHFRRLQRYRWTLVVVVSARRIVRWGVW
jgi:transposase